MRWGIIKLLGLLTIAAAAFSWIQFLWPPVVELMSGKKGFLERLLDPVKGFYDDTPMGGWLWMMVMCAVAVIFVLGLLLLGQKVLQYLAHSTATISVLETRLTLSFDSPDMERSTVVRQQLIHANSSVTAYRMTSAVSAPKARIDLDSFTSMSETEADGPLASRILNVGTKRDREIIEIYDKPLPTNWLATYLPNAFVYRNRHRFPKTIVQRTSSLSHFREYNIAKPVLQLTTLAYPTNNAVIELCFPEESAPDRTEIEVFLIAQNVAEPKVVREKMPRLPGLRTYVIKQKSIPSLSTLRISWSNTKLDLYKARLKGKVEKSEKAAAK